MALLQVAPPSQHAQAAADVARILICDDSVVIRGALARMLETDPAIRVVARAANGRAAIDLVKREAIDVVLLDIEMPEMDGLTALPLLLRADPDLRIIMASTLTTRGADIAMQALRLGAADYLPKPSAAAIGDDSFRRELLAKVEGLARQRHRPRAALIPVAPLRPPTRSGLLQAPALLAIGSSTGGPQALFTLFQGLPTALPVPVILTQHMPPTFTPILAQHLARISSMPCAEVQDGAPLRPGHVHVAPGDRHLIVEGRPGALVGRLSDAPAENFCRPAVDPMLRSAAAACGGRVLVVMLTGMGHDGLAGTRVVVEAGGMALAQDEASSVVWGMPGAIAQAGLCQAVLPIGAMAGRVMDLCRGGRA
jgi:two-component system chemotaxis response regulator CheB